VGVRGGWPGGNDDVEGYRLRKIVSRGFALLEYRIGYDQTSIIN
jgi:hypothetical protein